MISDRRTNPNTRKATKVPAVFVPDSVNMFTVIHVTMVRATYVRAKNSKMNPCSVDPSIGCTAGDSLSNAAS